MSTLDKLSLELRHTIYVHVLQYETPLMHLVDIKVREAEGRPGDMKTAVTRPPEFGTSILWVFGKVHYEHFLSSTN
jgi:hypothetical protein